MTTFFDKQKADIVKYVADITKAIQAQPSATTNPDGTKNSYGHAFDALDAMYTESFYDLDYNAIFDFSGQALDIRKRDDPPKGKAIGFPACTATTTSESMEPFPTLTKTCYTSSAVNCKFIYHELKTTDCPRTTLYLPSSCTAVPTFAPHAPPAIEFPDEEEEINSPCFKSWFSLFC